MKSLLLCAVLLGLPFLFMAGCNRVPPPMKPAVKTNAQKGPADPFAAVLETFRYQESSRSGDDWTRFREGFHQLTQHFAKPEVIARLQLAPEDRAFLVKDVHLTEPELAEV